MIPFYNENGVTLYCGGCLKVMPQLDEQFDTIITDPPYGLKFMGKEWDYGVPGARYWEVALQVTKPGAMLLAFGGTRTHHRLMCAIEDAGWEIRDVIMYVYGSGFPKSHNISKAIDRAAGAEREVVGRYQPPGMDKPWNLNKAKDERTVEVFASSRNNLSITAPATKAAKLWDGWGTALKPAWEPIIVAMKPREGTFANNALKHGVAGLWVDGGRIPTSNNEPDSGAMYYAKRNLPMPENRQNYFGGKDGIVKCIPIDGGRWPANLIHDGSDEVVGLFPVTSSGEIKPGGIRPCGVAMNEFPGERIGHFGPSTGSAARFFYCAKASRKERGEGNNHPTVKPLALMRYLCRLTKTPTGGSVLDMFAGSGTTLIAALQEGRRATGIEISEETCQIAVDRLKQLKSMQLELEI